MPSPRRWLPLVPLLALALPGSSPAEQPTARRELWLYHATNFQVDKSVDEAQTLWKRAAAAGYTRVLLADSKLAKLGDLGGMEKTYFRNLDRAKKIAADAGIKLVPGLFPVGYSNAMLWHDPNLAEAVPVKDTLFVVKADEARPSADPPVDLGKLAFRDETVKIEGGVASVRDNAGNARFTFRLKLPPYRCYHLSAMVRAEGYTGRPQIAVLGSKGPNQGSRPLQFANLRIKSSQDWSRVDAVFDTLSYNDLAIYFGVWGPAKGELQWKDWRIEEVGLVNVVRRPGAPCVVKGEDAKTYAEGKDYEPIADPKMGVNPWKGSYDVWHDPPAIRTHGLPDGTRLRVSWYYPPIIYDDQVTVCPSEPKTLELLADEAKRVRQAFGPAAAGYMMSHDEIRVLNWDQSCETRHLTPGQILADNVRQCANLLQGEPTYVWSDMFDPFHNAVGKDYYLVNGPLTGSWEGLPKDVIVVNWNFTKRDDSLKFFADRGHRQVIAGYYDHDVSQIRQWLKSADKVPGVVGVMYTTWKHRYDDLEAFARACRE